MLKVVSDQLSVGLALQGFVTAGILAGMQASNGQSESIPFRAQLLLYQTPGPGLPRVPNLTLVL